MYSDRSLEKKKAKKMKELFIKLKFQPTGISDLHVSFKIEGHLEKPGKHCDEFGISICKSLAF